MRLKRISYLILFMIFALSSAIFITILCEPLFQWQLSFLNTQQLVGLTQEQVLNNYDQLLGYLLFPWVETLQMSDFPSSAQGAFHFMEVKNLFLLNNCLFIGSLGGILYALRDICRTKTHWQYVLPLRILTWIPLVTVIILVSSFNYWFIVFHQIIFNNDDWLFDPAKDPIINVLPESFFMWCFVMAVAIVQLWFSSGYFYMKRQSRLF